MTVADGKDDDPGRVFWVPVNVNGVDANFELGGYGITRISESFSRRCDAAILPDVELSKNRDPDGKSIFAGAAIVNFSFGGQTRELRVAVLKDECCQKPEKQGMLGFDVLRSWQWEVDPTKPSLTLRPPGTTPAHPPMAIVPLRPNINGFFMRIRIRNVSEDVALMPGSSFVQAGPDLQRSWDMTSGKHLELEVKRFGDVRTVWLHGDDVVELSKTLHETDLPVALIGDPKKPRFTLMEANGLGQCVLNRFVYCVEPKREQLRLIKRVDSVAGDKPRAPGGSIR